MTEQNTIRIDHKSEKSRRSDAYGSDYLSELGRLIAAYAPQPPRAMLEWGMGNSTRFLIEQREALGLASLHSLDHVPEYYESLCRSLPPWSGFRHFLCDLSGPKLSDRDPDLNYATLPLSFGMQFDIIYIDGRRRMECALTAAQLCNSRSLVLIHDYRRARYQSVTLLFDIIEDGSQFRAMRRKALGPVAP